MQLPDAAAALSALAQGHRLAVFRLLVQAGEQGVAAGEIAREVGVLANTLSTHLAILSNAGLIRSRREGRSLIYTADYARMRDVLGFLLHDCCQGRPELCAPFVATASCGGSQAPQ